MHHDTISGGIYKRSDGTLVNSENEPIKDAEEPKPVEMPTGSLDDAQKQIADLQTKLLTVTLAHNQTLQAQIAKPENVTDLGTVADVQAKPEPETKPEGEAEGDKGEFGIGTNQTPQTTPTARRSTRITETE